MTSEARIYQWRLSLQSHVCYSTVTAFYHQFCFQHKVVSLKRLPVHVP